MKGGKKMSKMRMIPWLLAFMLIFGFSNVAFGGGGGPEEPACDNLPDPYAGKFLRGGFTVSRDLLSEGLSEDCNDFCTPRHYVVHIYLKWGNQEQLFSFPSSLGTGDLCSYTEDDFKLTFFRYPCELGAADEFNLPGDIPVVPVISDLKIEVQDFCNSPEEMVKGSIVIRAVPYEPEQ
jgi:hypothetical protein